MSQIFKPGTGSGPATAVETLTGNVGGAVGPDGANNINIVGAGGVTVTGNPGTNTLTITATASSVFTYTAVNTSPYVVDPADQFLGVDSSGGPITIQLPNAPTTGRFIIIKDTTGSANTNNITVTTVGGAVNIDGATSYVMNTQYSAINVLFNGTSYEIW